MESKPRFVKVSDESYDRELKTRTESDLEDALSELKQVLAEDSPDYRIVGIAIRKRDDGSWLLVANVLCDESYESGRGQSVARNMPYVCYAGGASMLGALAKFECQLADGSVRLTADRFAGKAPRTQKKGPKSS